MRACEILRIPVYYPTLNQSHPDVVSGIESTVLEILAVQNDALLPINPPVSITSSPLERKRVLFDGTNGT